jgi:hypothetical protein
MELPQQALHKMPSTACSIHHPATMVDNNNDKTPDGSGVFYFRMNKGAKAWTKKYRTEIAASGSSVLSTFAAFPLDFAKSRMQSYNATVVGDASEYIIAYLNSFYADEVTRHHLADLQVEIAMIQPTHNADIVTTPAFKVALAKHGRTWKAHLEPKGTLLADVARSRANQGSKDRRAALHLGGLGGQQRFSSLIVGLA